MAEMYSCTSSTSLISRSSNGRLASSSTNYQRPVRNLLEVLKAPKNQVFPESKRSLVYNLQIGQCWKTCGSLSSDPK